MKYVHSKENNMKIRTKQLNAHNHINTFQYREGVLKRDNVFLPKMSKNLQISFLAMTHLAEGLFLNALLTLKVENSLICLVGTRIPTVSMMEW
jgi:hypothetical protein